MHARFPGGLALPAHKQESTGGAIRACSLPPELVLPLQQHVGLPAVPRVVAGDTVRRGECIAVMPDGRGAPLHAPAAGTIVAIEPRPLPNAPDQLGVCIRLRPDGSAGDARLEPWSEPFERLPGELRDRIAEAGIVGLGGGAFPSAEKLAGDCALLILNGAECEPWIACDDALLRERAADVVRGGRVLRRALAAERVLLAIEHDMPQAIAAVRAALAAHGAGEIELRIVSSRYPQGGERQLIQSLTSQEVPSGGLPREVGLRVFNVGTAAACWRAVARGEPLLSRIVSVTGPGVAQPANFEVALGTPLSHLIAQAGGYTARAARLLLGGPMMGVALPHDDFPIVKSSNCVLVLDAAPPDAAPELPCIRCGECARACPARLLPQQLHWYARAAEPARLAQHGLFDCIECGCCDLVCPSHIPLVQQFRWAKGELRAQHDAAAAADAARQRFQARGERLQREAEEQARQQAERSRSASSADAVKAALERARARKRDGDAPR
jgi:Na+-translocating ferredoxin:NAD+ oxidoreductase subunit C